MKKNLQKITCLLFRLIFPHIIMLYFVFIVEVLYIKEALGREALRLRFTAVGHSSKKPKLLVWLKNARVLFIY